MKPIEHKIQKHIDVELYWGLDSLIFKLIEHGIYQNGYRVTARLINGMVWDSIYINVSWSNFIIHYKEQ